MLKFSLLVYIVTDFRHFLCNVGLCFLLFGGIPDRFRRLQQQSFIARMMAVGAGSYREHARLVVLSPLYLSLSLKYIQTGTSSWAPAVFGLWGNNRKWLVVPSLRLVFVIFSLGWDSTDLACQAPPPKYDSHPRTHKSI